MLTLLPRALPTPPAIYIHVPRTGGNAVRAWLSQIEDVQTIHPPKADREALDYHYPAYRAKIHDSCPTLAFVRNPWDWHVSLYRITHKDTAPNDIDGFRAWLYDEAPLLRFGSPYNQAAMIADPSTGRVLVKTVLRYEDGVQQGVRTWLDHCGIPAPKEAMPVGHWSERMDYRAYYPKPEDAQLVATLCAWEIKTFGYVYGD